MRRARKAAFPKIGAARGRKAGEPSGRGGGRDRAGEFSHGPVCLTLIYMNER